MITNERKQLPSGELELQYYGTTARHYDPAYSADSRLRDIPFYVELAKRVSGRTLEVACGTGRVLLPTARAGIQIDGLDYTPALLEILRKKLAVEPLEVRERVNLHQGDMRSFALNKTYDLVTVPFRPLQHLFTVDDQLAAFGRFKVHLRPGGVLAFNVFYPNFAMLEETGTEHLDLEWTDPEDSSVTVRRYFVRRLVDKLNQFVNAEFIFRSYRDDDLIQEERSAVNMSYYTYPHIVLLLKSAGFRITEEYGSFERDPISICSEMIFVAESV